MIGHEYGEWHEPEKPPFTAEPDLDAKSITEQQSKRIHAIGKDIGLTHGDLHFKMKKKFPVVDSMADLTFEEAGEFIKALAAEWNDVKK